VSSYLDRFVLPYPSLFLLHLLAYGKCFFYRLAYGKLIMYNLYFTTTITIVIIFNC
jgi:hypothetical protein